MPRGRPSTFTQVLADEICERLSKGEPLTWICRDDHMPTPSTVWEWRDRDKVFFDAIARARNDGHDAIAADCLHIADNNGQDMRLTEDGAELVNHDHIQRSKLRVDTRLKLLAKWDPKRYGDKTDVNVSGQISLEAWVLQSMGEPVAIEGQARAIEDKTGDGD